MKTLDAVCYRCKKPVLLKIGDARASNCLVGKWRVHWPERRPADYKPAKFNNGMPMQDRTAVETIPTLCGKCAGKVLNFMSTDGWKEMMHENADLFKDDRGNTDDVGDWHDELSAEDFEKMLKEKP